MRAKGTTSSGINYDVQLPADGRAVVLLLGEHFVVVNGQWLSRANAVALRDSLTRMITVDAGEQR